MEHTNKIVHCLACEAHFEKHLGDEDMKCPFCKKQMREGTISERNKKTKPMTKTNKEEKYTKERIEKMALKRFNSILRGIQYIHNEFSKHVHHTYYRSMVGKYLKDRIEEQLMMAYGMTKVKGFYLQDEAIKDEETGNLISIGPTKDQLQVMEVVEEGTGEIIEKEKKKVLKKIEKLIYDTIQEQEQKQEPRKDNSETGHRSNGVTNSKRKRNAKKDSCRSDGNDSGGDGATSDGDSSDAKGQYRKGNQRTKGAAKNRETSA